ncbi:DUF6153 family protein [Promicromonospora vindobonensis]|uniref:DUF6153 family protein n=1 Tax=Promicromonospora vindobonensis TaxID=195748 RepID=A0ABW5VQG4_9MICO
MRVLSFLRSALTGPGRRLNGALVILTVIVGVVTMHSMSGSPTSHHAPHAESAVVAQGTTPVGGIALPAPPDEHAAAEAAGADHDCAGGCGGHDAAMAMCLMILVALLALVVPARRLLWRVLPAWSMPPTPVAVDVRAVTAPSLHELCILRT